MWDQAVSDGARALSGGGHWQVGRRIRRVRLAGCAGSWAAGRRAGPAGERNRAGRRERGAWVGFGTKLGWVLLGFGLALGFGLLFYFPFSFLFLLQTKFEFKSKFEFKPHSNKIMHQHECNKKFKPMINFNYLRNKN